MAGVFDNALQKRFENLPLAGAGEVTNADILLMYNAETDELKRVSISSIKSAVAPATKVKRGSGVTGTETAVTSSLYYATLSVVFSSPFADTNYSVAGTVLGNVACWVSCVGGKTVNGCTLYVASTLQGFVAGLTVEWIAAAN